MATYTQANRPMRVATALGEDALLLTGFHGLEAISQLFSYQLDLVSERRSIDPAEMLRTPLTITLDVPDGSERTIHGHVSRFALVGHGDDLTFYRAEVVPWLWFLALSRESRIYQHLSVLEIVEQVFKDHGYSDFEIRCTQEYAKREYCVQYRETHLNFVSRLLEEEGIFYFFEHADGRHVLVLADDNAAAAPVPGPEAVVFNEQRPRVGEEHVTEWELEHSLMPGKYTLWDYSFETPTNRLDATLGDGPEEIYEYPGGFSKREDGERLVRIRIEAEEVGRRLGRGESNCRHLVSGHHVRIGGHFDANANGKYLITQVQHFARLGSFRRWDAEAQADYRNEFLAIPFDTPYRPPLRAVRPVVHGSQTAVVVGPPGEEIHVDKHGRVKVQFHWDRLGEKDEKSSCWIRVATPWAGKGYGGVSIPRIGNEVVVAFEEGDPDRPLIIGSVYNADQAPPFELPGSGIQMGMKSRSSPGGGGHNEITMTDTKGKEMMNVHAQYDMVTTVLHDQTNTVNNNRNTSIAVDDTESVGGNQKISVAGDQETTVDGNQKTEVGGDREESVGGKQIVQVGADDALSIGGKHTVDVGGEEAITISAKRSVSVGADDELSAGANHKVSAGANIELQAGAEVKITAAAKITLSAGGSTIEIGPSGITIMTGAIVTVQGATIKLN